MHTRTANLSQDKVWTLHQGPEVHMDILQQGGKGGPLMMMGNFPSRPAPDPRDPIGVKVRGGGKDKPQLLVQLGPHLAHQLRSRWGMGAQVVNDHERHTSPDACEARLRYPAKEDHDHEGEHGP